MSSTDRDDPPLPRPEGPQSPSDASPTDAEAEDDAPIQPRRRQRRRHAAAQVHQPNPDDFDGEEGHGEPKSKKAFALLSLAALGVVYGDIGTSPLYAVNDLFFGHSAIPLSRENGLGTTSLILWALTIIVTVKYVTFVLRADHRGEGGVFSLVALLRGVSGPLVKMLLPLQILAAGLLYGEGLITPGISVLGAVEGLRVAAPELASWVVPITCVILTLVFAVQHRGTAKVGIVFGPVISVWFLAIGALGVRQILLEPEILAAVNPVYALRFLAEQGGHALAVLGSVILVVTGGEALYADMGHFGRKPIRLAWLAVVYPSLLLNYLGQGAFILSGAPVQQGNIFYSTVPAWGLYPMLALATAAAIIASQALITGAFSLTQQAIALGLFPRFDIVHTSGEQEGQIYLPTINKMLWIGCIVLVLGFQESVRMAAAYGLSVAGVMLVTSLAMFLVSQQRWGWSRLKALLVFAPLAVLDASFLAANSLKFLQGGWVPLFIGAQLFIVMTTWRWGRNELASSYASFTESCMTVAELLRAKASANGKQLPRSIVFMASRPVDELGDRVPPLLQLFHERYGALPKHVIFLTVKQLHVPFVPERNRHHLISFHQDGREGSVMSVQANYGYMERPEVREDLAHLKGQKRVKVPGDPRRWLVLAGQENVIVSDEYSFYYRVRMLLFRVLLRNSAPAWQYFGFGADSGITTETIHVLPHKRLA